MARKLTQCEFENMLREFNKEAFDLRRLRHVSPKREHRFQVLLDNLGDFVFEVNEQGIVTYANGAAEKIAGKPLAEIVGKPFLALLRAQSRGTAVNIFRATFEGEQTECDLGLINGRICHFKNEPVFNECFTVVGIVGVARDATEQKRAEKAMLESYEALRQYAEKVTAELLAARKQVTEETREHECAEEHDGAGCTYAR